MKKLQSVAADENLASILEDVSVEFSAKAAKVDAKGETPFRNFKTLKSRKVLSKMIPVTFGGGGASYSEMIAFIKGLAMACPSTALVLSMHQHVLATSIVNARLGRPGEKLLRSVVQNESLVSTTVANDWIPSNGSAVSKDDRFIVTAKKSFVSGAQMADILMTSARTEADEVIHFAVPASTEGLSIGENWDAHGMRGTGSVDVHFEGVSVHREAVTLQRPANGLHPLFLVVLVVAPTLIMSCYLGIAERARQIAIEFAKDHPTDDLVMMRLGKLEASYATAKMALDGMVALVEELDFSPDKIRVSEVLLRKSILSRNVILACEKAVSLLGGKGYLKSAEIERLSRDARASAFHPFPTDRQQVFTGQTLVQHP